MRRAFVNGRIHAGETFLARRALLVEGERIAAIVPEDDARLAGAEPHDVGGRLLLPGFIDTQVNGGGGVLFNDAPTVEGIRAIAAAHARFGTTGFLPTGVLKVSIICVRFVAAVVTFLHCSIAGQSIIACVFRRHVAQ